jgi:hypothetical protein
MIEHILIIVDGKDDNTLDIVDVIESLPIDDNTNILVSNKIESAINFLNNIKPKTSPYN